MPRNTADRADRCCRRALSSRNPKTFAFGSCGGGVNAQGTISVIRSFRVHPYAPLNLDARRIWPWMRPDVT